MDNIELDVPIFFTQDDKKIIKFIKQEGPITCRYVFGKSYISQCLEKFDGGYVIFDRDSSTYQNWGHMSGLIIKGFTLFQVPSDIVLLGQILCGNSKYKGTRLRLLKEIENYALSSSILDWQIYALPVDKLVNLYEDFGFVKQWTVYNNNKPSKGIKSYFMVKKIIYEDDNNEENDSEDNSEDD